MQIRGIVSLVCRVGLGWALWIAGPAGAVLGCETGRDWARLGSSGPNTVARHQEGADPAREYTSTPARHEWPISAATKPSRVSVHALTRPRGWSLPGPWGGPGEPVPLTDAASVP